MVTVVCTGGETPPDSLCLPWLDAAGSVVAADGGLALLRRLGRRAHLWVGDGDSLPGGPEAWSEWFERAEVLPTDKDDSDTAAAFHAALRAGATELWLLGGSGLRMDHWWANLHLVAGEPALTRWLTAHEEGRILRAGAEVDLAPGTVSILPLGTGPWAARSEGLQWPLAAVDFGPWYSLSNRAGAGGARVTAEAGSFLVLRPHGGPA